MQQLKMVFLFDQELNDCQGEAIPLIPLMPDGFYIRSAVDNEGVEWCRCCLNGELKVSQCSQESFHERMLSDPTVKAENILFICDKDNNVAGTATAREHDGACRDFGRLHMVAVADSYKGKGLALPICAAVVNRVREMGYKGCVLTTDDFRIPAIRTYIRLGFIPVLHDETMKGRWEKLLPNVRVNKLLACDGDFSPLQPIINENCKEE